MFVDESGFLLIPTRRRTWGLRGQTPIVRYSYKHDRISALAALSVSAQRKRMGLYVRFQQCNFRAQHVAVFLRQLLHHLRGTVVLLWDNGPIHKGPVLRSLRSQYPRLHVEFLPGYAPELNPVEFIWQEFKGHSANRLLLDKQDIRRHLHASTRRVRRSQARLRGFVLASELPSPPW